KVSKVVHHAALPWRDLPTFMAALSGQEGMGAAALRLTILCATRTSETVGATWAEIDLAARLWTIPPERMKTAKEHRIPLSDAAMAILGDLAKHRRKDSDPVFMGPGRKKLSTAAMSATLRRMGRTDITVHGFRSTFRDWCSEATSYDRAVAEMSLAHSIGDKVEAAYRRGDLIEKRTRLMNDWSAYCSGIAPAAGEVVHIGERRA
ncbi:MAG: tyrosine-type recombinase/integrase, partial [Halothiobacillaceae bacterium]